MMWISFSRHSSAHGKLHVTLQSVVGFGQIVNSSEILWLSSLPIRMKKIQLRINSLFIHTKLTIGKSLGYAYFC